MTEGKTGLNAEKKQQPVSGKCHETGTEDDTEHMLTHDVHDRQAEEEIRLTLHPRGEAFECIRHFNPKLIV